MKKWGEQGLEPTPWMKGEICVTTELQVDLHLFAKVYFYILVNNAYGHSGSQLGASTAYRYVGLLPWTRGDADLRI
jgi:hypothetical protein